MIDLLFFALAKPGRRLRLINDVHLTDLKEVVDEERVGAKQASHTSADELLLIETIPCVGQRFCKRSDRVSAEDLICERKSCFRFDCHRPELSWLM